MNTKNEPLDDAFIVYRYVDRFIAHKGLTYNDGEYVDGFTSLLCTVMKPIVSEPNLGS